MPQLPQPLVKHPGNSPNPLKIKTTSSDASFVPRKEFIKDNRVASSFSLLALSGAGFVRLYSFSAALVAALRRRFTQLDLLIDVRENLPKHFFEFSLDGKPWSRPKGIASEKLIVDILTEIFHCGYAFLSTIDYGREQDDRLAIAFSRPGVPGTSTGLLMQPNGSLTSLIQPVRQPFAISFSSVNLLRVVGPPLQATPAVLQAVRGAWPRGVVSEKKVGDAVFEFKLKGYKWFQEDTFATDSLHHILGLLSALDTHGFTLLTSLTLTTRSRVKDFWVFTGFAGDDNLGSIPPTPTTANGETRREGSPYGTIVPGPSPLSAYTEKRAPSRLQSLSPIANETTASATSPSGTQSASHPARQHMMPKPSPGTQVPVMFLPEYSTGSADATYPSVAQRMSATVDLRHSRPPKASRLVRSLSNPSSVGSEDMTGVGAARGKVLESPGTPDVFYATDGRPSVQQMQHFKTYEGRLGGERPHAALVESPRTRRASLESRMALAGSTYRPGVTRSSTLPLTQGLSASTSTHSIQPQIQVQSPSPVVYQGPSVTAGPAAANRSQEQKLAPSEQTLAAPPHSPTPHLLPPTVFQVRDSAYTSLYGRQSQEIPIVYTGQDPEPNRRDGHGEQPLHNAVPTHQLQPHIDAGRNRQMEPTSSGPPAVGWSAPTQREEGNDVGHKNAPIKEHSPTKVRDKLAMSGNLAARRMQHNEKPGDREETRAQKVEHRREEGGAGLAGPSSRGGATVMKHSAAEGSASTSAGKPPAHRRETTMSGWVMVNVETSTPDTERAGTPQSGSSRPPKSSSQTPPPTRPTRMQHQRSMSDSRLMTTGPSPSPVGPAPVTNTMSAAAKAIAMIDATEARDEKMSSTFKRIFGRSKPSQEPQPSRGSSRTPPGTWTRKSPVSQDSREHIADLNQRVAGMEDRMRARDRDRARPKGIPAVTSKSGNTRINLD
ncbi:hypothetical protein EIP86_002959 [Pleurotus ostreatoroseus]|nr:hypothetical protein EIP86_002959 [Pleurotus ostreatoroseus]